MDAAAVGVFPSIFHLMLPSSTAEVRCQKKYIGSFTSFVTSSSQFERSDDEFITSEMMEPPPNPHRSVVKRHGPFCLVE